MKSIAISGIVTVFAVMAFAGPAASCPTWVTIHNKTDVSINPTGCSTQKNGSSRWLTNIDCANYALEQDDRLDPGHNRPYLVKTGRKAKTKFKVRFSYRRGVGRPTRMADSDFAKCSEGHTIVVN